MFGTTTCLHCEESFIYASMRVMNVMIKEEEQKKVHFDFMVLCLLCFAMDDVQSKSAIRFVDSIKSLRDYDAMRCDVLVLL